MYYQYYIQKNYKNFSNGKKQLNLKKKLLNLVYQLYCSFNTNKLKFNKDDLPNYIDMNFAKIEENKVKIE